MLARDGTMSREGWNDRGGRSSPLVAAAVVSGLLFVPGMTKAEPEGRASEITGSIATTGGVATIGQVLALEAERKETAEELANLSGTISLTKESISSLDAEIASLAADRGRIRKAMIEAAAAQKAIEMDIAATEARIGVLAADEGTLKASLRSRRGLLAEVLGALERMGRKPPPALLVHPDDALGSVRSAILLGAVVPRIRKETEKLAADLDELSAVRRQIAAEKERYVTGMTEQREEEARLARLFGEKEKLEAGNRSRREAESARAAELAAKATSLQDLITSLEAEAESARAAEAAARRVALAEAARQAEEQRLAAAARAEEERLAAAEGERRRIAEAKVEEERIAALADEAERAAATKSERDRQAVLRRAEEERLAAARQADAVRQAALAAKGPDERATGGPTRAGASPGGAEGYDIASLRRDMTRLESGAPFSTLKGRLTRPVSGTVRTAFAESDGIGRPASGTTFRARPGDVVTAPSDGQVLYSGPFRSYGQLLILDAGDGYHVVLAGMDGIDVAVGQFVLSGEPVASMGAKRLASSAGFDFGTTEPSLYVEFRKDGKPVDPAPWWADGPSGRTRNDS